MIVFLNPHAGAGRALSRWHGLQAAFSHRFGPHRVVDLARKGDVQASVDRLIEAGHDRFVAAGGDGTVNLVASALAQADSAGRDIRFGAIGLGSSNDYHKPCRSRLQGRPARLDFDRTRPTFAIEIRAKGHALRHAFITASVGVTAEANDRFNRAGGVTPWLKRSWPDGAVLQAAVRTILEARPMSCHLNGLATPVNNLAVLLTPFCAGFLSYGPELTPDPGKATVALCHGLSRMDLVRVLRDLARGRFRTNGKVRAWQDDSLMVEAEHPFAVEFDGEVLRTTRVAFAVRPQPMSCCP